MLVEVLEHNLHLTENIVNENNRVQKKRQPYLVLAATLFTSVCVCYDCVCMFLDDIVALSRAHTHFAPETTQLM